MNSEDAHQQIANLKQAILRSKTAVAALQNFIRVTDNKLKKIEAEVEDANGIERTLVPAIRDNSLCNLKMF